ncbi:GntR family transcriptional regulator [Spongisporangium articulatum]|uniref:GntR family transcriptional regulator n=1 Tax=Spongisporangium articulatum TaxID=3362603 RepID=A0ABW8AL61_9ACTN
MTSVNEEQRAPAAPLAEQAYVALRDLVVTLQLPPGTPLNEDGLTARLGVGRTPLREAIKRLEAENLIVIYPRRGTFVAEIDITDHGLICDVRRQLEGLAAYRAAQRATEADKRRLAELAATLRRHPGGRRAGMQLDTLVHREVYKCCHNRYLQADLEHYYDLSLRIWYLFLDRLPEVDHRTEHLPMLEAIQNGDADGARTAAAAHVTTFERAVRSVI